MNNNIDPNGEMFSFQPTADGSAFTCTPYIMNTNADLWDAVHKGKVEGYAPFGEADESANQIILWKHEGEELPDFVYIEVIGKAKLRKMNRTQSTEKILEGMSQHAMVWIKQYIFPVSS